jgi:hypothetical protein
VSRNSFPTQDELVEAADAARDLAEYDRRQSTYTVNAACENCLVPSRVTVAKGERVGSAACPHCGCQSLAVVPQVYYRFGDGNWTRW